MPAVALIYPPTCDPTAPYLAVPMLTGFLREHGVEYVCDWVNDDLPYRMSNGLYSIPYSIELNDMPLFNAPSIDIQDFHRRICETFDVLYCRLLLEYLRRPEDALGEMHKLGGGDP